MFRRISSISCEICGVALIRAGALITANTVCPPPPPRIANQMGSPFISLYWIQTSCMPVGAYNSKSTHLIQMSLACPARWGNSASDTWHKLVVLVVFYSQNVDQSKFCIWFNHSVQGPHSGVMTSYGRWESQWGPGDGLIRHNSDFILLHWSFFDMPWNISDKKRIKRN